MFVYQKDNKLNLNFNEPVKETSDILLEEDNTVIKLHIGDIVLSNNEPFAEFGTLDTIPGFTISGNGTRDVLASTSSPVTVNEGEDGKFTIPFSVSKPSNVAEDAKVKVNINGKVKTVTLVSGKYNGVIDITDIPEETTSGEFIYGIDWNNGGISDQSIKFTVSWNKVPSNTKE